MWRLGGLGKKLTWTALFMGMAVLSLSGIPPFRGFYSKDAVIATAIENPATFGWVSTFVTIAGILSIAYIGMLWLLTFAGEARDKALFEKVKAPSRFWIVFPLGIMAAVTLLLGFVQEPLAGMVSGEALEAPHINALLTGLLSSILVLGLIVFYYYNRRLDLTEKIASHPLMKTIHGVFFNGYYIEYLVHWLTHNVIVNAFAKSINWIDQHIIDATVNGMIDVTRRITGWFGLGYTGKAGDNSAVMTAGLLLLLLAVFAGGSL